MANGKVGRPKGLGRTPGSGRKPNTPNKVTADVRALAQKHTSTAITELARIAAKSESDQARVAAIKELLDRGHGRPTTVVAGDPDAPLFANPVQVFALPDNGRINGDGSVDEGNSVH